MALIGNKPQKQQTSVGQTYGERRAHFQSQPTQVATQRPQAPKPLDKFAGISTKKNKGGLAGLGFAANATFRAARRFSSGAPYKRPLHDHIEKGTAPVAGHKNPPSDNAILNFLDRVIKTSPTNPRIARNKAVKQGTAPVNSKQQVPQKASTRTTKA